MTKIDDDTGWKLSARANPMRGYHDYDRTIRFIKDTSQEDMNEIIDSIMREAANGNMWYSAHQDGKNVYRWELNSGYDSGD